MSFNNRGIKRNSFGNPRNSFGRSGGGNGGGGGPMGGGGLGGISGGQGNRGMNPWETGSMPGRGILPTPSNNMPLNSSQAELVIVSNLLNNLIRTQQDPQPQVPSLLSLGTNGPLSNFRNQGNFGNAGRFNDRSQRQGNVNNKNQRVQPYNKMGNNRARDGVAGRRGPSSAQFRAQSQSGNQRNNGNQNQHRNDKNTKASKKNETSKKEQLDVKKNNEKPITENVVKSEETEEGEDKKRDWKDEKKDGDSTMEVVEDKTTVEGEKKDNNKDVADKINKSPKKNDDNSGKKPEVRHAESRYSDVPINQMDCHVCTKRMWDGASFENHLRGRAHQLMMEKLDESYKLKVDLMRHELRVSEEQREMSLNNSKRRGKKVNVNLNVREYCTMCDLNFYGTLTNHRKSDKHQQLKTFLHPRCVPCSKEFPSRIEYDEHRLTPGHMINSIQVEEQKKNKKPKLAKGESEVCIIEDEEKDTILNETKLSDKDDEPLPENTEYLFDIIDDMDMKKYKIPSYKYCKQKQMKIGASMVKQVQGYHCDKCRKFMLTEDAMEIHLKTQTHYKNFSAEVKLLTTPPTPVETTVSESIDNSTAIIQVKEDTKEEEKIEEVKEEVKETDKPLNVVENKEDDSKDDDYDGNFKRRKVDTNKNEDNKVEDIDEQNDSQMDEIDDIDDDCEEEIKNIEDNKNETVETEKTIIESINEDKIEEKPIENVVETIQKEDDKEQNGVKEVVDESQNNLQVENGNKDDIVVNTTNNDNNEKPEVEIKTADKVIEIKTTDKVVELKTADKVVEIKTTDKVVEKIDNVIEKVDEKKLIEKISDVIPEAPPAPIISTPNNQNNRQSFNNSKNNSPNMSMHTPNKTPRGGRGGGGGFRGNRGHQRARRSRR